jgi:superfamily II DNA or RNA helicase
MKRTITRNTTPSNSKTSRKKKTASEAESKVSRTHKPDGMGLEEWQTWLRKQFAENQPFRLENIGLHPLFSEFRLINPATDRTYRLAIRGLKPGDNFCSCPDYRINNLGTCKHLEYTLAQLMKRRGAKTEFRKGYSQTYSEVYLRYGMKREVCFKAGLNVPVKLRTHVSKYFDDSGVLREKRLLDFHGFMSDLPKQSDHEVRCYDDVLAFIAEHQDSAHRHQVIAEQMPEGTASPLLDTILKTVLHPYQKEGALFALTAGRCLIGDDMGLGKTIQALAAAELMAELFGIRKVLIVSPTSLKHQWRGEIERFTSRSAQVIEGLTPQRQELYRSDTFYKLINYELVARDSERIRAWEPDLIILDEAQRIKNWQTQTAKAVKGLESTFAIVLTGTPIENRIEELHSIMEFVDRHHFGPLYRFVHTHRVTDASGKLVGYQNLEAVRKSLQSVMIRRLKREVLKQLPERMDKNFLVPLTPLQAEIHCEQADIVARLVAKWKRNRFLCEADQKRLMVALATMRMVSDNTWLVDHKTKFGPKIEELETLLLELVVEGGEKVVIFSQWLRMNGLVEEVLNRNGIGYVHLNGSVPSKNRKALMSRFKDDPDCKVFLSTDAGGVGLNLQSGSVVINMDIPWNPAVLEQRIARVHRMGQKKNVRVVNFISKDSIEERILDLLRFKSSLCTGALDADGSDVVMIGQSQLERFMESVEAATDNLPVQDSEQVRQEQAEAERETATLEELVDEPEKSSAQEQGGEKSASNQLQELLMSGARLLSGLSDALGSAASADANSKTGNKPADMIASFIESDDATGKNHLKIPLPEPAVMQSIFSGLEKLFAAFGGGGKG